MRKTLLQRARELPMGLWTAAEQFNIRHLIGDLVQAYKRVRDENRQLREEKERQEREAEQQRDHLRGGP